MKNLDSFVADFDDLSLFVKWLLKTKNIGGVDYREIINTAFVEYGDSVYIKKKFLGYLREAILEDVRSKRYSKNQYIPQEVICYKCKKLLPSGSFGITNVYRYGGFYVNSHCRDCAAKNTKYHYEKIKQDPVKLRALRDYQNKWRREKRAKLRELKNKKTPVDRGGNT